MPAQSPTQTHSVLLKLAILFAFCGGFATLSSSQAEEEKPGPLSLSKEILSKEKVEELKKRVTDDAKIDDALKKKILDLYSLSLSELTKIQSLQTQTKTYQQETGKITQRVEELNRERIKLEKVTPEKKDPTLYEFKFDFSLPELEQEVSKKEVELARLKKFQTEAETEASARVSRRKEIRAQLLAAPEKVNEITTALEATPPKEEPELLSEARKIELKIREKVLEEEQLNLKAELAKYDAEDATDYLRLLRDVRKREANIVSAELKALQEDLEKKRAEDSKEAILMAEQELKNAPALLKPFAEANLEIANQAHLLTEPIEKANQQLATSQKLLEELQKKYLTTKKRVDEIGLTRAVGALLRRQRAILPDLQLARENILFLREKIELIQYESFEYDDDRAEIPELKVETILQEASQSDVERVSEEAKELIDRRRQYLSLIIRNNNTYLERLFELDTTERRLIVETEKYANYISERVFWIQSNRALGFWTPSNEAIGSSYVIDEDDYSLLDPEKWEEIQINLINDSTENWGVYLLFSILGFILIVRKPTYVRMLASSGQIANRGSCKVFTPTLKATYATFFMSVLWPGLIFFVAWRLNSTIGRSDFTHAVAHGLFCVVYVFYPLDLLRRICRENGLAHVHFDWPHSTLVSLRQNIKWICVFGLPTVFVTSTLYANSLDHDYDFIERVSLLLGMILLTIFMRRVFQPDTGILFEYLQNHRGGWLDRLKPIWYWGFVCIPLFLGAMAAFGYYYTAYHLSWRIFATFNFIFLIQLIRAFLYRFLLVNRRKIRIQELKKKREQQASDPLSDESRAMIPEAILSDANQDDIAKNLEKSKRLITTALVTISLVGLWFIWIEVLPALRILDQLPAWTTQSIENVETSVSTASTSGNGDSSSENAESSDKPKTRVGLKIVSVADVAICILILTITFICAKNIPGLLELALLRRLPLDDSTRYAISSISSYFIILIGILLGFNAISIGWSKVQWLATALTFGLAFGLQEIFANFVAGIILLFERPIRIGDVVTIDDVSGVVAKIRIRATTIRNWDRKEYIVPNKEFITGKLMNWTLTDKTNRVLINVGIAYGSDIDTAKKLLKEICQAHPIIMKDPPAVVTFEGFGDNTLNLVIRTYLPDVDNRLLVIDDLHTTINRKFKENGIEIAFPQRDLHLRSVDSDVAAAFQSLKGK